MVTRISKNPNISGLILTGSAEAAPTYGRIATVLFAVSLLAGCRTPGEPRIRVGHYPTATWGMRFVGPNEIGPHSYTPSKLERTGILYTRLAGHIDLTHVRSTADWTKYIAEMSFNHLMEGDPYFTFKSNTEPSLYHVHLSYPSDWKRLPRSVRESQSWPVAVDLGAYIIFQAATWHEILTWFGHRFLSPFPEFPSAFSWEDTYSNALGIHLAQRVLQTGTGDYDRRFTSALEEELDRLGALSAAQAKARAAALRGQWYTGQIPGFVKVRCRNIDIGLHDGLVSPVLVPSAEVQALDRPAACPVPRLTSLADAGLSLRLEIEPRERVRGKILGLLVSEVQENVTHIEPALHFPPLMEHIRHSALEQGMILFD